MDSIHLMHFPELDPATHTAKQAMRERLERDIADYLARGGQITAYAIQIAEPAYKRSRREQVDHIRLQSWKFNKGPE